MTIAERLDDVRTRIEAAAVKAGRAPEEVKLIAVTKTVPPERIREALDQGVARIGENRVQELVSKEGDLPRWKNTSLASSRAIMPPRS